MRKIKEKIIAVQTALNLDLLGCLVMRLSSDPEMSLSDFFESWQKSINWDQDKKYSVVNQGVVLTHLYGLIVFPKEVFKEEVPKTKLNKTVENEWGNFEFLSFPSLLNNADKLMFGVDTVSLKEDMTLEFVIRKIRNAISHANVEINEEGDFIFFDKDDTKIKFTINGLQKFTERLRSCYLSQKED
jgi:hypothetical protein